MSPDPSRWQQLAAGIGACTACDLAGTRTRAVPGDLPTPPGSGVLLVGEGPGADEDAVGRPFVGRSGRLLDALLDEAGLERSEVAVANVVKCRPPGNRAPRAAEVRACRHWLVEQVEAADPAVVVALGGTAVSWFLGPSARLTALRGTVLEWAGRSLVVTYHPSAALRFGPNGAPMAGLREDLAAVADLVRGRPPTSGDDGVSVLVAGVEDMERLGRDLARVLRPGDLVLLSGDLGAGKTTLARGIGAGLGVRGAVTSPTFVIARVHPATGPGPDLVHVDAYRLGGLAELDDLDLDTSLVDSVTVVEWGEGRAESLSADRLEVRIERPRGGAGSSTEDLLDDRDRPRTVRLRGVGDRWSGVDLPRGARA